MMTATSATRILCFGDSNTWGQKPDERARYTVDERWTALLQRLLGVSFDVIEEGLNSRTTDLEYAKKPGRNGKTYLLPCLQSHNPLDGVVLMLGTNDCKTEYGRNASEIASAVRGLVEDIRAFARDKQGKVPKILIMSPAPINDEEIYFKEVYTAFYDQQSVQTSRELPVELAKVAADTGCSFFDIGTVAATGVDGVHLTPEAHKNVAKALAPLIKEWAS